MIGKPLGIQMYTLRNWETSLSEKLQAVAAAGYSGVEPFGPLLPPADEFAALLQQYGLRVCSTHVALATVESETEAVVKYHATLGNDTIVVPWLAVGDRPDSKETWQALGLKLDKLGAEVRSLGARLLYHNHDFEMVVIDGRTGLQWMVDAASPENLGLEIDAGWVVAGGQDPIALLREYTNRVPRLHAKEAFPAGIGAQEEGDKDVGEGLVDWDAVLAAAAENGVEWVIAEHDNPTIPAVSLVKSAEYLLKRW